MEEGAYYDNAGLPPSQGPPVLDDGRTGSLLSDILSYSYYSQVLSEARNYIPCHALSANTDTQAFTTGLFSSLQSGPIQGMGEAWMPHHEYPLLLVRALSITSNTLSD